MLIGYNVGVMISGNRSVRLLMVQVGLFLVLFLLTPALTRAQNQSFESGTGEGISRMGATICVGNCPLVWDAVAPVYQPIVDSGAQLFEINTPTLKATATQEPTLGMKIVRVWVADPYNQFHKIDRSGGESVPQIINRGIVENGLTGMALVGSNASFTKSSNYDPPLGNFNLTEGKVTMNNPGGPGFKAYGAYILYTTISKEGKLTNYGPPRSTGAERTLFAKMIDDGIRNTIGLYHGMQLIQDYQVYYITEPRSAIRISLCQVNKNNFIYFLSTRLNTMTEHAEMQKKYGCLNGVNLDGGGSTNLFYKQQGEGAVTLVKGSGRVRPEAIYFSEY